MQKRKKTNTHENPQKNEQQETTFKDWVVVNKRVLIIRKVRCFNEDKKAQNQTTFANPS
jgi:hypothetical protein